MEGRSAPIFGLALHDVEDEAREFGPEGKAEPEIGVYWNCEGESNDEAEEAGGDDVLN